MVRGRKTPFAGTVTIVVTDLVGSTEIMRTLGDDAGESVLRRHLAAMRTLVTKYGGTEVKSLGDGIMSAFSSATAALDCAAAMQHATKEPDPSGRLLQMRVGIHAGEATSDEFDFYGTPVVIAKRLCDRASDGETLVSDVVKNLVGSRGRYSFADPRTFDLKGIGNPVQAWRYGLPEGALEPAPASPKQRRAGRAAWVLGLGAVVLLVAAGIKLIQEPEADPGPGAASFEDLKMIVDSRFGDQPNSHSYQAAVSRRGRYVAFVSQASNLFEGDDNASSDVFLYNGTRITPVSVSSGGADADGASYAPDISSDGRTVTFVSEAGNLAAKGDDNGLPDVFVYDRVSGRTRRASSAPGAIDGNGASMEPSISGDGRYVAFTSKASNLVDADTNRSADVFVTDTRSWILERVSRAPENANGDDQSRQPAISGDGRYVAFSSRASNLVEGDTNGQTDIFVHDRATGSTTRVSRGMDGEQSNGRSTSPAISGSGRRVAFVSSANNLVPGDDNRRTDVFVHDLDDASTTLVSTGAQQANDVSLAPAISGDGTRVAFVSAASNLLERQESATGFGAKNVFLRNVPDGRTYRLSIREDGRPPNDGSFEPDISVDGRAVVFASKASNLLAADTNDALDVFLVLLDL